MKQVPQPTIERLITYYRYLEKISVFDEVDYISSLELGKKVGISAANVRKDFSHFGEFGCKGVGYHVDNFKRSIKKILGFDREWPMILVGVGNLGSALVNYRGFRRMGLKFVAAFDCDLNKIGNRIGNLRVRSNKELDDFVQKTGVEMAVLTVPANEAVDVANQLVRSGIRGIWNFAPVPIELNLEEEIIVFSDDISSGLASLMYRTKTKSNTE
ncbi:MAG: redox-sensing transcriptional repressor Rex [Halanaerobiales bacterium]